MQRRLFQTVLLAFAAAWLAPAHAQGNQPGSIELRNVAEIEKEVKTADGKTEKRREPAAKAAPGAEVIYTSTFRNTGSKPAGNISVVNPVPVNTTLVGGSATGENTDISFSADGGKTWAAADKVKVRGADGKERPAGLSEFTHVRWVYRGELAPGKQGVVSFRVTVN
ncbi:MULTISPECIES: DUF11 domain-containing protein [Ramlibacter]|uniref:DUF11 domain-containing protein n=1 Tax=Ramlibacter pinisoli TaxID=2682844 RepID=A0A6N8IUE6_9BURK|nr:MULTISPECIES: DUF11 domain-containing protein [Ramlibacter]MBA2965358.1 DUF11 domain-containing protein [Ramlibacter sp. CGMCC 1.13660]MVQ30322.1 DUF11 domain-containing protein [Ramlibacter pinisoli]